MLSLWLKGGPWLTSSRHLNTYTAYLTAISSDVGLALDSASTKGQGLKGLFRHCPINAVAANRFSYRAAAWWNNLPLDYLKNNSLKIFKKNVLY